MENNEIMMNEEIMETTEEIATAGSKKAVKVAAGVGLAALVSFIAYKCVVKPLIAKAKAKKETIVVDQEEYVELGDFEEETN